MKFAISMFFHVPSVADADEVFSSLRQKLDDLGVQAAIAMEPMVRFHAGDLITGINRSYQRSIYKVVEHVGWETLVLELEAFDSSCNRKAFSEKGHQVIHYIRAACEFRLATPEEIEDAYTKHYDWKSGKLVSV